MSLAVAFWSCSKVTAFTRNQLGRRAQTCALNAGIVRCQVVDNFGRIAAVCIAVMLSACSPDHPPPEGFEDACYGGHFSEKLDGATPSFSMYLQATQKDWSEIARRFQQLGEQQGLRYFDTSVHAAGLRMLNVHLCSPMGLWLVADKRLWDSSPDPTPDEIPIHIYVYEKVFPWKQTAQQLRQEFADWPTPARIEWNDTNAMAPDKSLDRTGEK